MKVIHCKDWDELYNIHNKNGMYIIALDGTKYTFKNNEYHSYNGKLAIENSNGDKCWFRNGMEHRLYGPAVEFSDGSKMWWLFGLHYFEDEYNEIMKNAPLFYWKNRDKL